MSAKKTNPQNDSNNATTDSNEVELNLDEQATLPESDEAAADAENAQAETDAQPDPLAEMTQQLAAEQKRAAEYLDSLQRERATFQNYKKRVERERVEQRQQAKSDVLLKLLPTLDDFYRAMEAIPANERDDDWFNGITLILRKLERFLEDQGVTAIEAQGQEFDPNFHEAVGVDVESDADSGTITAVMQRGYMLGERVLRPAMVRVAQ